MSDGEYDVPYCGLCGAVLPHEVDYIGDVPIPVVTSFCQFSHNDDEERQLFPPQPVERNDDEEVQR